MRLSLQVSLCVSTIVLSAGLLAGTDLASANRDYQEKNYDAAMKDCTPLAEEGNADAQVLLGRMYMMGQGVNQDRDRAIKWFKAAAVQGNADANFSSVLCICYPSKMLVQG